MVDTKFFTGRQGKNKVFCIFIIQNKKNGNYLLNHNGMVKFVKYKYLNLLLCISRCLFKETKSCQDGTGGIIFIDQRESMDHVACMS